MAVKHCARQNRMLTFSARQISGSISRLCLPCYFMAQWAYICAEILSLLLKFKPWRSRSPHHIPGIFFHNYKVLKLTCYIFLLYFADRSTAIGKTIDSYLQGKSELDDHAIHLMFSANRWEMRCSTLCDYEKNNKDDVQYLARIFP